MDVGYVAKWDRSELSMNYFSVKSQGIFHSNTLYGTQLFQREISGGRVLGTEHNFRGTKLSAENKGM
jgi:hypothetical protein